MPDSGLSKLKITAYADSDFTRQAGDPFLVIVNPARYSHGYTIKYVNPQAQGSTGGSPRFNKIPSETVSFELVFDGTGVIPSTTASGMTDVQKQLDAFKSVVFNYSGKIHSPKFLILAWGTLLFKCRLTSLSISYTLFKPDGTPLRATAETSYCGYTDEDELAKLASRSSPDVTHLVTLKAGDTLPMLCWDIYGTSAYYVQVARANGLAGFRDIPVGTRLLFPPLAGAAT
jgi:phage tail protein X